MIKFKYKGKSIIIPLKLCHYEYDDDQHRIKNTQAIANMIFKSIDNYDIVPVAEAELEDRIFQIVSISSDGPYIHSKHVSGCPQIEHDLKQLLYTGPLFLGWLYDGAHELDLVRKSLINQI